MPEQACPSSGLPSLSSSDLLVGPSRPLSSGLAHPRPSLELPVASPRAGPGRGCTRGCPSAPGGVLQAPQALPGPLPVDGSCPSPGQASRGCVGVCCPLGQNGRGLSSRRTNDLTSEWTKTSMFLFQRRQAKGQQDHDKIEMQIKATRCPFLNTRVAGIREQRCWGCGEAAPLSVAGGNAPLCGRRGEQLGGLLLTASLYGPAPPLPTLTWPLCYPPRQQEAFVLLCLVSPQMLGSRQGWH